MNLDAQSQSRFIGEVIDLITSTIFVVIGFVALVVAAIRRRAGGWRAVLWLGIWSAIYGVQRLNDSSFLVLLLPHRTQVGVAYSHALATYFVLVAGLVTAIGTIINPYVEYYADHLPQRYLGAFGIGL